MSVKLTNRDYIWSYIGVFLSLFSSIIMVPFVIYYLDGENYGLWGVFQSLVAITNLFDFGFATTFARNINYCWSGAEKLEKTGVVFSNDNSPNYVLMKKTMIACKCVFLVISGVALLFMLIGGTIYISHISTGLKSIEPIIAWNICSFGIFLNLYFGYYGSFLRGVGAISDVNKATVIAKLVQIIITIFFLSRGFGLIGTSVAYLSYGALFLLISRIKFYRYCGIGEGLKRVTSKPEKTEIKNMFSIVWHNAWREGIVSLSNYLANQACTIIISLYIPLTETGAYSLGVQLANAVAQVSSAMYTANQPVLQSAYVANDKKRLRSTMSLIVCSYTLLHFIGIFMVTFIGLPLLRLIRPETIVSPAIMVALGFYQFILKFRNCYTSYFSCTNRIPYVMSFLLSSLGCVVLAFFAMGILHMGVWGIILAQLFSQCIYNGWIWALRAHKELELSISETFVLGRVEIKNLMNNFVYRRYKK